MITKKGRDRLEALIQEVVGMTILIVVWIILVAIIFLYSFLLIKGGL